VQKVLTRKKNLVKIVLKRIVKNQSELKCRNSIRQNFKQEYRQLDNVFKSFVLNTIKFFM